MNESNQTISAKILTVVVLDANSQPEVGANVSISPSGETAVTNNVGEVQFKLGDAIKYEITASADSTTVTVPYYVTKNGATRLVVNPVYVESVQSELNQPSISGVKIVAIVGLVLAIIVVLVVIWKLIKRRRRAVEY